MIVSAAVRIFDFKQNKFWNIPCHRHWQAFYILKEFGYKKSDFREIAQGFLDERYNFYDRVAAHKHAWGHGQLKEDYYNPRELFSEDLW